LRKHFENRAKNVHFEILPFKNSLNKIIILFNEFETSAVGKRDDSFYKSIHIMKLQYWRGEVMKKLIILLITMIIISVGFLSGCTEQSPNYVESEKTFVDGQKEKLIGRWTVFDMDWCQFNEDGRYFYYNSTWEIAHEATYTITEDTMILSFKDGTSRLYDYEFIDYNTLQIKDEKGIVQLRIRIIEDTPKAQASANKYYGEAPLTVQFTGSGLYTEGTIVSWSWDFGDGGTSTEQNPSYTFQSWGTYTVTFTVEDNGGLKTSETLIITVNQPPSNKKPTSSLSVSTNSGDAPFTVTFVMNANDEDGSISFWALDVNNDGTAEYSASGSPPSGKQYTYTNPGTYTAKLTVTDNEGATNSSTVIITVNTPPPQPITFRGSGDDVTSKFSLQEGLAIFHMTYTGSSNYIIWLYNADSGEREDLLVNEIGSYSGSTIVGVTSSSYSGVKPGKYILDVTSSGSWEVRIEQPNPSSAPNLPQTFTGRGDTVPSPFMIESGKGAIKFNMHHDGSSNFIIWLYHVSGKREELVVNEIGYYDGSKLVSVGSWSGASPGIHYLDVTADGNWRVEISYL
jgi:PKD repeat protein